MGSIEFLEQAIKILGNNVAEMENVMNDITLDIKEIAKRRRRLRV